MTIVQERLPIKIAIINNGYLGMVRQWQELFHDRRYSVDADAEPRLRRARRSLRHPRHLRAPPVQVEAAIEPPMRRDGPMLLEFQVEREVNVYPMVAPGASISDMITESVRKQSSRCNDRPKHKGEWSA